jgi:phosphatidylinositol alpha-1,6-mannosyltransferase
MKTALIITSEFPPGPGGIGQHAASLVLTLSTHYKVDVLCNQDYVTREEINNFDKTIPSNVQIHPFTNRKLLLASIRRGFQAWRLVQKTPYDLIIVSGLLPLWIGAFLKQGTEVVVHGFVHGNEVNSKKSFKSWVTTWSYRQLDYLYPVSSFTKKLLNPVARQTVKVIPNGLDQAFLLRAEASEIEPSIELKGDPALLTVGNVTLRKGQHRVIQALPTILEEYPNAHYHIVGLPTHKATLSILAANLGVSHAITFHGRLATREELYQTYRAASLFIMLSENQSDGDMEGFGIAILEANAFGLPAIGALGCGIEDAISEENGILVDGDNTGQVLSAINTLLANMTGYERGAKTWAKRHNWERLVKMMIT